MYQNKGYQPPENQTGDQSKLPSLWDLGAGIYQILISALVILKYWAWFIVPITSLSPITYPQAIGLWLLFDFVFPPSFQGLLEEMTCREVFGLVLGPLISLILGWFIQLFI